jgi:hypothetical protein
MIQKFELSALASKASTLVSHNLRSKAIVIARLLPLIERAVETGYGHDTIRQVFVDAGMNISLEVYKNALHRARKGAPKRQDKLSQLGLTEL